MQITFIGGGNMASAIIAGLYRDPHQLHVVELHEEKRLQLQHDYQVSTSAGLPAGFNRQDIIILAVKPQALADVCRSLAACLNGALVISIAAGVKVAALSRWLGTERIIRVMPNTPAMIGMGASGLFAANPVDAADREAATTIMQAVGITRWLENEGGIDDITAVSGSGPAYVFYFIESMIDGAIASGFDEESARELVLATFAGATELARRNPLPLATLRQNVMSKGGTTERAIARFEQDGVKQAIIAGMADCKQRSLELGEILSKENRDAD